MTPVKKWWQGWNFGCIFVLMGCFLFWGIVVCLVLLAWASA